MQQLWIISRPNCTPTSQTANGQMENGMEVTAVIVGRHCGDRDLGPETELSLGAVNTTRDGDMPPAAVCGIPAASVSRSESITRCHSMLGPGY